MLKQLSKQGSLNMGSLVSEPFNAVARQKCSIVIHSNDFEGLTIEEARLFMVADELCRIHGLQPNIDFESIPELFAKVGYHEKEPYPYPRIKSEAEIPQQHDKFEFSELSTEYIRQETERNHAFALISGVRSSKSFSTIVRNSIKSLLQQGSGATLIGGASYSTVRNIAFGANGYATMIPFGREKRIGSESSKFAFKGILADENGIFPDVELVIANLSNKNSEKRVRGGTYRRVILEEFDLLEPLSINTALDRSISSPDRESYFLGNPVFFSPEHDKILQRFSGEDIEKSCKGYTFYRFQMSDNMSMTTQEIEKVRLEMEKLGEAYLRQRFYGYRTKPTKTVLHSFEPNDNIIESFPQHWKPFALIAGCDDSRSNDAFCVSIGLIMRDPNIIGDRAYKLIQIGEIFHKPNDFSNIGDFTLNKRGRPLGLDRFDDVVQRRKAIDDALAYTRPRVEKALADRLGYTINAFTNEREPKKLTVFPCYVDPSADDLYSLDGRWETRKGKNGNSFKKYANANGDNRGTEHMYEWLNLSFSEGQFLFLADNAYLGMDRYKNNKTYQEILSYVRDDYGKLVMSDRQGFKHYDFPSCLRYTYFGFRSEMGMLLTRDFWDSPRIIYKNEVDPTPNVIQVNRFPSVRA